MDYDLFAQRLQEIARTDPSMADNNATNDASNNNGDETTMPDQVIATDNQSPTAGPSTSTAVQDVVMADVNNSSQDEDEDMPALQSISDSDSDVENDVHEVEMHTLVDDPPLPEITPAGSVPAPTPTTSVPRPNRRARVEDDEDDERDRRHPSERISTPLASNGQSTASSSSAASRNSSTPPSNANPRPQTRTHPLPFPFNLFTPPPPPSQPRTQPTPAAEATEAPRPPPAQPQLPPFLSGGIAISIDIGGDQPPVFNATPFNPGGNPDTGADGPQNFADFFTNPGFLNDLFGIEPDVDDPERAERLINGLEEVPIGLVKRLERVGGMTGANGTELSGGDSGCAVCWEKLLDPELLEAYEKQLQNGEKDNKVELPKIVSLPCAHVFHAECLRPWFSRPKQTTCPTCRFNIDPENLTFVPYRQRRRAQQERAQREAQASATNTTPAPASTTSSGAAGPSATAAPSASTSTSEASQEARGRMGPPPVPNTNPNPQPSRRPSSEPPTNRRPRPATGFGPEVVQSFAVPGGHVVIVNHPIGIITDAQGRPTGGSGQRTQANTGANGQEGATSPPAAAAAGSSANAGTSDASASTATPQPASPPVFGPPPPPSTTTPPNATRRTTMPGGGNLPPGVVAFDLHLPFPLPFMQPPQQPANNNNAANTTSNAANPSTPTPSAAPATPPQQEARGGQPAPPPLRLPRMGFAGVNFANRQPAQPMSFGELLRAMYAPPPTNENGEGATNNAAPTDANAEAGPSTSTAQPAQSEATTETASNPSSRQSTPSGNDSNATNTSATNENGSGNDANANANAEGAANPQNEQDAFTNFARSFANSLNNPAFLFRLLMGAALAGGPMPGGGLGATFGVPLGGGAAGGAAPGAGAGARGPRTEQPKKDWTPPPAPGPTLRQRVERREREAGLRCCDVSCGVGPSDDDPFVSLTDAVKRQFSIRPKPAEGSTLLDEADTLAATSSSDSLSTSASSSASSSTNAGADGKASSTEGPKQRVEAVCPHTFHSSCLVSAERVASRGADAVMRDGVVEVSCPVCRGEGCVSRGDWEQGVRDLA
ncbi:hypothetical protein CC2G_012508 [Coprinopsis cinerea AmutBmut pab1-1]|nr:hypothetical protein CC2G_012508 [Coprinopsis cinerea AmutBmut pab1-1]